MEVVLVRQLFVPTPRLEEAGVASKDMAACLEKRDEDDGIREVVQVNSAVGAVVDVAEQGQDYFTTCGCATLLHKQIMQRPLTCRIRSKSRTSSRLIEK